MCLDFYEIYTDYTKYIVVVLYKVSQTNSTKQKK